MSRKDVYRAVRMDRETDQMIRELSAYNNCSISETIRRIFMNVPKYHALIPADELKKIRENK